VVAMWVFPEAQSGKPQSQTDDRGETS